MKFARNNIILPELDKACNKIKCFRSGVQRWRLASTNNVFKHKTVWHERNRETWVRTCVRGRGWGVQRTNIRIIRSFVRCMLAVIHYAKKKLLHSDYSGTFQSNEKRNHLWLCKHWNRCKLFHHDPTLKNFNYSMIPSQLPIWTSSNVNRECSSERADNSLRNSSKTRAQ